jgi:predicted DsbA family dithiol-disulfide isomerase
MDVELFISPYCTRCRGVQRTLRAALSGLPEGTIRYTECNVIEYLDRAVDLGITATPALVINGKLKAIGGWNMERFRQSLRQSLEQGKDL